METWVCRQKNVPGGKLPHYFPDFPESFYRYPHLGWQQSHREADRVHILFQFDLNDKERVEMRKRGNVPLDEEKIFVPASPRTSDGVITGLSIDGVTRIAEAKEVSDG